VKTRISRAATLWLALALTACGDDDGGFSPTVETVAGSYTASVFTLDSGLGPLDLLGLGATVTATLNADGTTTGRLFVPQAGEQGEDLDEDLTGTWTLTGRTVTFSQTGSSLITGVDFVAGPNTLTGEGTFEDGVVLLVLTRDD
jgi:hypothetical protein